MGNPCVYDPTGKLKCRCSERDLRQPVELRQNIECDSVFVETRVPSATYLAGHTEVDLDSGQLNEISCAGCGSETFEVFQGSWWTGLKCSNCGTSSTIHEG